MPDRFTTPELQHDPPLNRAGRKRASRDLEAQMAAAVAGRETPHVCSVCGAPTAMTAKIDGIHAEHRPYCARCYARRMFKLSG